ncbi:MAG: hypothetical protein LBH32_09450 [Dysgonamonadaceae bacterium]|nr:hypothetical protein [Dysgonamonadaceae bacterium]
MKKVFLLTVLLYAFTIVSSSYGQATIGMTNAPQAAALLDLKSQESTGTPLSSVTENNNVTSTLGGLLLPRVKLVSLTTLEPFITVGDLDQETRFRHAGLTVYNLTDDASFDLGSYAWNGSSWEKSITSTTTAMSGEVIWLPSFNLKWTGVGVQEEVKLFDKYKDAYIPESGTTSYHSSTGTPVIVPDHGTDTAADFYYVVTYYDNTVVTINSINNDTGLMSYTPKVAVTPDEAFMNIMLVRK